MIAIADKVKARRLVVAPTIKTGAAAPKSLLVVDDAAQGSEEWLKARLGIPTASMFSVIMAEGADGEASLSRQQYLYRLAGEQITGEPAEETFKSRAMERGKEMEPAAVADYERRTGRAVKRVGFARNFSGLKLCGASADGLVGFDRGLETKTMRPDLMIPLLLKGARMLPQHRAQVHGNMLVWERDLWDFKIFYPGMPDFTVTVERDETYVRRLHGEVERFNYELKKLVEQLRDMGAGR
jgi:hypothetical protein